MLHSERLPCSARLFNFPSVVDDRVARVTGMLVFIAALLCAVWFDTPTSKWVLGGMMVSRDLLSCTM